MYLQCSSGKLSPERRKERNPFRNSSLAFSPRQFKLDTMLLNDTSIQYTIPELQTLCEDDLYLWIFVDFPTAD